MKHASNQRPHSSITIDGDTLTIRLPHGQHYKLRHLAVPQDSPSTSQYSTAPSKRPSNTILHATDYARRIDNCILHEGQDDLPSLYHSHKNPLKNLLEGAAWILLAEILSRYNASPLTEDRTFNALKTVHPDLPEPDPHIIPIGQTAAIPVTDLPADKPPLVIDRSVIHARSNRSTTPTTCTLQSLLLLAEHLPWTLVQATSAFQNYRWWQQIPHLAGISFPRHPDHTAILKSIRARIAIATRPQKRDKQLSHRVVRLPWLLNNPEILWATNGHIPHLNDLVAILRHHYKDSRSSYGPPTSDDLITTEAVSLLSEIGQRPSPEQLQSTADEILRMAREKLPSGYSAEIHIIPDPAPDGEA